MGQELITRDMNVGEIVEKYPRVAMVLTGYGLHCVGCHVAKWETLGDGAASHGMDEETVEQLLRDANAIAKNSEEKIKDQEDLVITPEAIDKIKEFQKNADKKDTYFKIEIVEGGCSGKSYSFSLEEKKEATDKEMEREGIKIILSEENFRELQNSKIDYLETIESSGFKIYNPNAKHSCGCGKSFA